MSTCAHAPCSKPLQGRYQDTYCSRSCAAKHRWDEPGSRERWAAAMKGRPAMRPGTSRECAHCAGSFVPTSNRQRYCRVCGPTEAVVRLIRLYGVNQTEWDRRLIEQGGKCAVCQQRPPTVVDHDHQTGIVGALLCVWCNGGLGFLENAEWRAKADAYLARVRPRMRGGGAPDAQAFVPQDAQAP